MGVAANEPPMFQINNRLDPSFRLSGARSQRGGPAQDAALPTAAIRRSAVVGSEFGSNGCLPLPAISGLCPKPSVEK